MLKVFPNTHFGGIDAKPRSAIGRLSSARSSPGSVVWPVRKLTPTHIEAFEAQLQQDGHVKGRKASQGLTAQTVLHVHRTLSQALAHAVNAGVLFKNPAEQVKPPRPLRKEIAILSKPEIATLLRASEGTPLYLPVLITVTTGVRRGELLALRWSDIDLKAARLTVNQSLERLAGKTTLKPPKTSGSHRTITLPALTVEALRDHRSAKPRIGAGELVFSHDGIPWDLIASPRPSTDWCGRLAFGASPFMGYATPTSLTS